MRHILAVSERPWSECSTFLTSAGFSNEMTPLYIRNRCIAINFVSVRHAVGRIRLLDIVTGKHESRLVHIVLDWEVSLNWYSSRFPRLNEPP